MKHVLRKYNKKIIKMGLPALIIFLLIDFSPLVTEKSTLTAEQAQLARNKAKMLSDALSSSSDTLELRFNEAELLSIGFALSHVFNNTQVAFGYNPLNVQGGSSSKFSLGLFSIYINVYCEISLEEIKSDIQSRIDHCKLGDIPIPGFIVNTLFHSSISLFFDREIALTANNIIENIRVENTQLVINAKKTIDFKARVNASVNDAKALAKIAINANIPAPEHIQIYLDDLAQQKKHPHLFVYIKRSMQLAAFRSVDNDPILENRAALWAWAMSMGSQRFAALSGIEHYPDLTHVTLRERRDLSLHFLISAMLTQFGSYEVSFNIGEFKEILDSGKGGSGFSFADLLADKAGIAFAKVISSQQKAALNAQQVLLLMDAEDVFFPFIHDVPEGLSNQEMTLLFGGTNSPQYTQYVTHLQQRIDNMPLYANRHASQSGFTPNAPPINNGQWIKIDTHVHSRYSDGSYNIDTIANKAQSFGCAAIAITDHGDINLNGVLSDAYFSDIQQANSRYVNLTIMPGLEWNVPPFMGREHATVLLPQSTQLKTQLRQFRSSFDHYEMSPKFLSIEPALKWLNALSEQAVTLPVVIYNHPSRKDVQISENRHDLTEWFALSNTVIGFSGAPGHQRLRKENNGAYDNHHRTVHGLDPISSAKNEWDKLLQKGLRVLGARASSDFHNLESGYWPCEFSSTHVFAASNRHNDILQALRSGRTWAQHGQFVKTLAFTISSNNTQHHIGEVASINQDSDTYIDISMIFAEKDWQGAKSTLDELSLVVITDTVVSNLDLTQFIDVKNYTFDLRLPISLPKNTQAVRLIGKSNQLERHDYQVFTNPIFIKDQE